MNIYHIPEFLIKISFKYIYIPILKKKSVNILILYNVIIFDKLKKIFEKLIF